MKYLSLFSGIGGLEYGLRGLGECVGYSEIRESSLKIYERNCGIGNRIGDITKVDFGRLKDFDLLLGGFPCQSFSLAGMRKGFKDERGKMIFYIYEILKGEKPSYFILENVRGILDHERGSKCWSILKLLSGAGYFVRVVLLNALDYGVAQNRERVFFLSKSHKYKISFYPSHP